MNAFKKLYYRLLGWQQRKNALPLDIDFSDAVFIGQLERIREPSEPIRETLTAADNGQLLGGVRQYFVARKQPVVFHAPEKMAALIEGAVAQFPAWKARTVDQAKADLQEGLEIYGMQSPPLQQDYPWAGTDQTPGKDLQYRKRPHRFSFLPRMALASVYEPALLEAMHGVVSDWARFAESGEGCHLAYDSSLAVIQRLLATTWSWLYLSASKPQQKTCLVELQSLLLKIIFTDIRFLMPRLGHSFANNHLLADYFAGWFIGKIFPEFTDARFRQTDYEQLWIDELLAQTYPDGWSFEHSIHYHEFACDMGLCYLLLSRANDWQVPSPMEERIRSMLLLQAEISGPAGTAVRIGDCIEDNFFPLGVHEGLGALFYREIYRGLFDSRMAKGSVSRSDVEVAYWLLGGLAAQDEAEEQALVASFDEGGLHCFRDPQKNLELLFRSGPSADTGICAGHAHADWLSIYLSVNSVPVIVDAGTYSYRFKPEKWPDNEPEWRAYFSGPHSHNGVVIGDQDPLGTLTGDFRPKQIAARVRTQRHCETPVAAWVSAAYDKVDSMQGYVRGVVLVPGEYVLVYDRHPDDSMLAWAGLQFAPTVSVSKKPQNQGLKLGTVDLFLSPGFAETELLCGSFEPLGGWVSERYGVLQKAPQARFKFERAAQLTAFLLRDGGSGACVLEVDQTDSLKCFSIRMNDIQDRLILSTKLDYTATDAGTVAFDARLLWIRKEQNHETEIRATDVKAVRIANNVQITFSDRERWAHIDLRNEIPVVKTASGQQPSIIIENN